MFWHPRVASLLQDPRAAPASYEQQVPEYGSYPGTPLVPQGSPGYWSWNSWNVQSWSAPQFSRSDLAYRIIPSTVVALIFVVAVVGYCTRCWQGGGFPYKIVSTSRRDADLRNYAKPLHEPAQQAGGYHSFKQ